MIKNHTRKEIEAGKELLDNKEQYGEFDITAGEIQDIVTTSEDSFGMICNAFILGFSRGTKATKKEKKTTKSKYKSMIVEILDAINEDLEERQLLMIIDLLAILSCERD